MSSQIVFTKWFILKILKSRLDTNFTFTLRHIDQSVLFDRRKIFMNGKIEFGCGFRIFLVSVGQQVHDDIIDFGNANDVGDL